MCDNELTWDLRGYKTRYIPLLDIPELEICFIKTNSLVNCGT